MLRKGRQLRGPEKVTEPVPAVRVGFLQEEALRLNLAAQGEMSQVERVEEGGHSEKNVRSFVHST